MSGECDRKRQDVVRVGVRNDLRAHSTFRWDLQGRRQQQFLIILKCRMRNQKNDQFNFGTDAVGSRLQSIKMALMFSAIHSQEQNAFKCSTITPLCLNGQSE